MRRSKWGGTQAIRCGSKCLFLLSPLRPVDFSILVPHACCQGLWEDYDRYSLFISTRGEYSVMNTETSSSKQQVDLIRPQLLSVLLLFLLHGDAGKEGTLRL